jgi:hypothetical protein
LKPLFAFRRADFQVEVCPFQVISVSKYFASARHLVSWQNFQLETTHTAFPAFDPPLLNTAAPGIFSGSPVGSPFYFPSSMAAAATHAHASDVVVTTVVTSSHSLDHTNASTSSFRTFRRLVVYEMRNFLLEG